MAIYLVATNYWIVPQPRTEMGARVMTTNSTDRELTEIELDAVSGGDLSIQKHLDQASSSVGGGGGGSPTPTSAWNTLLYQYGYIK